MKIKYTVNVHFNYKFGFPGGLDGKESACNAGDPGLISGSGRSPGEGISYPLQCYWGRNESDRTERLSTHAPTWEMKALHERKCEGLMHLFLDLVPLPYTPHRVYFYMGK